MQKMLEAEPQGSVDPDDPAAFVRHYQSAWQRAGFQLEPTDDYGNERYTWKEGIFSVEVTKQARSSNFNVYAFIDNVTDGPDALDAPDAGSQNAYAHKVVKTEEKALTAAIRLRHELATSMAARLVKLGFNGWRNHWHKPPISVTLKPSKHGGYANISLQMDYLPNDAAIKALTALDKFVAQAYPES